MLVTRIHSGSAMRGNRDQMMEILEIHAEEWPGFPAMIGLTRAIRWGAARVVSAGDRVRALLVEPATGWGYW
jgi:hypothetical protein